MSTNVSIGSGPGRSGLLAALMMATGFSVSEEVQVKPAFRPGRQPRRAFHTKRPSPRHAFNARTPEQSARLLAAAQAKRERKALARWKNENWRRGGYYFWK